MSLPHGARVLLVRLSAMGDVLFSLETLASLKNERPDVRVDFLVEDRFASVLRGHPMLEQLHVYPRRRLSEVPRALWALRRTRYDAVLDLHGNTKSAIHTRLARAQRRLGYDAPIAREGAQRLYSEVVTLPSPRPHRADQGYHLLRALGLRGEPARAVLPPAPGFTPTTLDVILHPGTSDFARFKRWPTAHFAELARRLTGAGVAVGVSGGPGEQDLIEAVRSGAEDVQPIRGANGLVELGAAYGAARAVVAADTGPLHLAAAAGTPVVALFGPKDVDLYGPRGDGHRVLFHDVPCRPCRRRSCASPLCVLGLSVDRVEAAVHQTLGTSS